MFLGISENFRNELANDRNSVKKLIFSQKFRLMAKYEIAVQKIENSSKLESLVKKIGNWSELELSQNRFFFSKVEI